MFWKQADYWTEIREDYDTLTEPYSESDFDDTFKFLRKFCILQCLFKKYIKVDSTYINGLFKSFDRIEHDTDILVPDVTGDMSRTDNVVKMHPRFQVNEKDTKRWSSGFHTIIAHSDIKTIVTSPEGYLLSYFDISSAEVRSIAYISKDPVLVGLFESQTDVYVYIGKKALPDLDWDNDPWVRKTKRGIFKQVLLGSLYGMGFNTLAKNSGISVEEAQRLHEIMFSEFKVLKKYTDELFKYPLTHDGYIKTFFGDKLRTNSWKYRFTPDGKQDTGALARASRHGCNYVIQNGSAIVLASGFWNNIRVARRNGIVLEPIVAVHDSSTSYFPCGFMPMLRPFYDENFTEFSRAATGVPFLFDLLVGNDYQNCAEMKQIDKDTVELKGSNLSLKKIIDKLDRSGVDYLCNVDKKDIQPIFIKNPMERFIKASIGTSIEMDSTKNKIQLKFNPDQYKWKWDK